MVDSPGITLKVKLSGWTFKTEHVGWGLKCRPLTGTLHTPYIYVDMLNMYTLPSGSYN